MIVGLECVSPGVLFLGTIASQSAESEHALAQFLVVGIVRERSRCSRTAQGSDLVIETPTASRHNWKEAHVEMSTNKGRSEGPRRGTSRTTGLRLQTLQGRARPKVSGCGMAARRQPVSVAAPRTERPRPRPRPGFGAKDIYALIDCHRLRGQLLGGLFEDTNSRARQPCSALVSAPCWKAQRWVSSGARTPCALNAPRAMSKAAPSAALW